ncbi:zinc finger protein 2 homolog isoform X2 [Pararge aegeria]|uniref:zinc finger protein 2 homolog isoform X2 n=1 Tax=Pararge aegeria TaxID=116150 RepID=UPI0019D28AE1|nr:zinc finger protein 2 homolog isoform X2 [Pararge aegeria]
MSLQTRINTNAVIRGLCRTCLAKEIELLSVFDLRAGKTRFDSIIATITGIKITQGDVLPTTICNECKDKASKAYDFKINAQQSEDKLVRILKKGAQDIICDDIFTSEIDQKNVKMEQFIPDDQDNDDMDLDISLPFVDHVIKNESDVKCEIDNSKENLKAEVLFENESEKNSSYCPVCCQNFPDVDALTEHAWELHTDLMGPRKRGRKKKLTSTILHKLTENGMNLKEINNPQYNCIFCHKTFKTKHDLILHTTEHKDEKIFSCMLCKKIYLRKKDFERHICLQQLKEMANEEDGPPVIKTEERKHQLYTEVRLQDLLKKNIGESGLISACDSCGGIFGSEEELNQHRDRDHPELSVRCHLCDKVFATLKSASRHRAVCERVERLFACPSCELRFTHEVTLNKHILRVHTGQSVSLQFLDRERGSQNYKCETCSRPFTRKDLLERHMRSHNTGEKIFECDICKKKFTRRENLRAHLRTHEGKKYAEGTASLCLYCGRSFTNSSNYIVHMRRHTGEKPYKCDFCGKGFCRSSDLQCHRRSHTGEKPCVCRECGKAFSRSNKLTRHMRVHTGVKPYKCTYCEKAFAQSNDLTVHVRRHTGDKPYVCELCGDRFIQGTALHAHRRSHGHYPPPAVPQPAPLIYTIQNTIPHCPSQT